METLRAVFIVNAYLQTKQTNEAMTAMDLKAMKTVGDRRDPGMVHLNSGRDKETSD